jgi:predicted nucleic acid-binding protein
VIVVINTCPLTNLASIGQVDLLQRLYQQVAIAEGVCSELNAYGKRRPAGFYLRDDHYRAVLEQTKVI